MIVLDKLEKAVLEKLIFEENFHHLQEDCKGLAPASVITDILRHLIHRKLVVAKQPSELKASAGSYLYDADRMHEFTYQSTAKGLKLLESPSTD